MMRIVIAPDKFKGSVTASQVAAAIEAGLAAELPGAELVTMPVADGGDGTVDAAVVAGFERVPVTAAGPTGEPVRASYPRRGAVAVVELASVCGLTGEGSLDTQSLSGKAPVGVALAAARRQVPVVAVAGRNTLTARQLAAAGISAVYTLSELEPDPALCHTEASQLLQRVGRQIARDRLGAGRLAVRTQS
jgi:glycerate kinase